MFLFLGKYLERKQSGKIFNKIFWEEKKNHSMVNIGILALGDYSFTPLDARSALIATALIATTYLDCSFKKGRILEGHKRNRNLWQSDCWAGSHGKWSKKVVTISRLIGAGQAIIIWFWSWGLRSQNILVGSGTCVKFSVSGFRPCMTLKLGQNENLSGSKVVQLYLFLLSEESIQLHLVVSLMKDHYGNSFSLVSMWANAFSLTSSIHDTNN